MLLAGQGGNRGVVRIHKFIRIYSLAVTVLANGRGSFTCKTAFALLPVRLEGKGAKAAVNRDGKTVMGQGT